MLNFARQKDNIRYKCNERQGKQCKCTELADCDRSVPDSRAIAKVGRNGKKHDGIGRKAFYPPLSFFRMTVIQSGLHRVTVWKRAKKRSEP